MTRKHILIVGAGSAGKRHASNLHSLGCSISCVDPREDKGDPDSGIAAGTLFADLPDDWVCPMCGAAKVDFEIIE